MNVAKKMLLNVLGGAGSGGAVDTSASFTATTVGAATLEFQYLNVSAPTTVEWGDGNSDVYTGSGARTHNYAGAGTWTVKILEPENVTRLAVRDAKFTSMPGAQLSRLANLTVFGVDGVAGVVWDIGPSAPMPAGMTNLSLINAANISWGVGVALPTGLTDLLLYILPAAELNPPTGFDKLPGLVVMRYENGLTTAQVNEILRQMWVGFATRTATGGTVDLLGYSNQGPTGPVSAENPPTYGGAYAYELVNDTGNVNPSKKWTSITTATPV